MGLLGKVFLGHAVVKHAVKRHIEINCHKKNQNNNILIYK